MDTLDDDIEEIYEEIKDLEEQIEKLRLLRGRLKELKNFRAGKIQAHIARNEAKDRHNQKRRS